MSERQQDQAWVEAQRLANGAAANGYSLPPEVYAEMVACFSVIDALRPQTVTRSNNAKDGN